MNKKALKLLTDEALIIELLFNATILARSTKFYKCDIKSFDNALEEAVYRGMIKEDSIDYIKKEILR